MSNTNGTIKRACIHCRQQKIRCNIGIQEDPATPCSRCQRLKLDCVLAPLKRKLRVDTPSHQDRSVRSPRQQLSSTRSRSSGWQPTKASTTSSPDSAPTSAERDRPLPRIIDNLKVDGQTIEDLHHIFFNVYDFAVPILDPTQPPDHYYATSPLLFWAMMAVASRRYLKDPYLLYRLFPRVKKLASTSVGAAPPCIHVVEALLFLLTWWFPNQALVVENPFVLAGSLLHFAIHLGLHRPLRSQDYARTKLLLTNQDLIRRTELWTRTVLLYQRYSLGNEDFCYYSLSLPTANAQTNHLWNCLPEDLRHYSSMQNTLSSHLLTLSNESQRLDDGTTMSNIAPLIRIADASFTQAKRANTPLSTSLSSTVNELYTLACRFCIYLYHLHTPNLSSPEPMTFQLYSFACEMLTTIDGLQTSMPSFISAATHYLLTITMMATYTLLKLLKTPSFCDAIDSETGKAVFFTAIRSLSHLSIDDNDMAGRSAVILGDLWRSKNAFRDPETGKIDLSLRIRSRGCKSIVYDCAWWWREEFGGQPNTYSGVVVNQKQTAVNPSISASLNKRSPVETQPSTDTWTNRAPTNTTITPAPDSTSRFLDNNTLPPSAAQSSPSTFHTATTSNTQPLTTSSMAPPSLNLNDLTDPSTYGNISLGDQMLADLGWDAFDDFLFLADPSVPGPVTGAS